MIILKAVFSEDGSNRQTLEKDVYAIFVKYVMEVASKYLKIYDILFSSNVHQVLSPNCFMYEKLKKTII